MIATILSIIKMGWVLGSLFVGLSVFAFLFLGFSRLSAKVAGRETEKEEYKQLQKRVSLIITVWGIAVSGTVGLIVAYAVMYPAIWLLGGY